MKKVLAISPHPDDAEFGCGASLAMLAKRGAEVTNLLVTASELTVGGEGLLKEFASANSILGVKSWFMPGGLMRHRGLQEQRQELLDRLIIARDHYRPDTVLIPCMDDTHQDHAAVAAEAFRAFKRCDILGYDILWNTMEFKSQAFFEIEEWALDIKIKAVRAYQSQAGRPYADPELITGAARMRGAQAGVRYAEAFANIRRYIR